MAAGGSPRDMAPYYAVPIRGADGVLAYVSPYDCAYWRPEVSAAILARQAEDEVELYSSAHSKAILYEISSEEESEEEKNKHSNARNRNSFVDLERGDAQEALSEEAYEIEIPGQEDQTAHGTVRKYILCWLGRFRHHLCQLAKAFCWSHA